MKQIKSTYTKFFGLQIAKYCHIKGRIIIFLHFLFNLFSEYASAKRLKHMQVMLLVCTLFTHRSQHFGSQTNFFMYKRRLNESKETPLNKSSAVDKLREIRCGKAKYRISKRGDTILLIQDEMRNSTVSLLKEFNTFSPSA